jgi:hypothetical protein
MAIVVDRGSFSVQCGVETVREPMRTRLARWKISRVANASGWMEFIVGRLAGRSADMEVQHDKVRFSLLLITGFEDRKSNA